MRSTIVSLVIVSVILALAFVVVTGPPSGIATSQAATPYTPYTFNDDDDAVPSIEPIRLRDLAAEEPGIGTDLQEPRELTAKPIRSPFLEDLPIAPAEDTAAATPVRRPTGTAQVAKSAYANGRPDALKAMRRAAKSSVSAAWQPRPLKSAKAYSRFSKKRTSSMFNRGRHASIFREWWE